MDNNQLLRDLSSILLNKEELKRLHNHVTKCYVNYHEEVGATDWHKQMNVFKIQLKLLSVLYEYNNNLNGAEPVSLNKITIVNGDGLPVNVKRDKQPGDNEVENNQRYSCPSCTNNVTEEV